MSLKWLDGHGLYPIIESRFTCQVFGRKGAHVRLHFHREEQAQRVLCLTDALTPSSTIRSRGPTVAVASERSRPYIRARLALGLC